MPRRSGLACLLGAMVLLSACKSKSQEATPAPAPATPPPSAAAPGSPALAPVSDETLSFIEKAGDKCKWVRLDAIRGSRKEVLTIDGPCQRVHLAWSHDGLKGAVLQHFEDTRAPRAWTVDLVTSQGTSLPLPAVGQTQELGFEPGGRLVALVAHYELPNARPPERVEENGKEAFVFEGQKYPIDVEDGTPGLAHAYRREGQEWKRLETKVSSYEWDLAQETQGLEAVKTLGPSTAREVRTAGTDSGEVTDEVAAVLEKSMAAKGGEETGMTSWARFDTTGGPVFHRQEHIEGTANSLGPVRWEVDGEFLEPEKLEVPESATIELSTRGKLLLIASDAGLRLYDAKEKKHLLSVNAVHRAGFWPYPSGAAGKPSDGAAKPMSLKLENVQAALDFLKAAGMKLEEGKQDCIYLTEHETVGKLVKKISADATSSSVQCQAKAGTAAWACKAEFTRTGGKDSEASDFTLRLVFDVDDAARAIKPGSLVCHTAG